MSGVALVNARDNAGWTPIHEAMRDNKATPDIVRMLVARGADVNARSGEGGGTALHEAAAFLGKDVVDLLLQLGADPEARNDEGKTPKDIAPELFVTGGSPDDLPAQQPDTADDASSVPNQCARSQQTVDDQEMVSVESSKCDQETSKTTEEDGGTVAAEINNTKKVTEDQTKELITDDVSGKESHDVTEKPADDKPADPTKEVANEPREKVDESSVADEASSVPINVAQDKDENLQMEDAAAKNQVAAIVDENLPQQQQQKQQLQQQQQDSMDLIQATPELESPSKRGRLKSPKKELGKSNEWSSPGLSRRSEARTSLRFSSFSKPVSNVGHQSSIDSTAFNGKTGSFGGSLGGSLGGSGRRSSLPSTSRGALLLEMSTKAKKAATATSSEDLNTSLSPTRNNAAAAAAAGSNPAA